MIHKILLENRYEEKNYLVAVDKHLFQIEFGDKDVTVQLTYEDTKHTTIKAIDLSGGPMLCLGEKILKWKIVEIYWNDGWFIKVEKDDIPCNKTTRASRKS